MDWNEVVEIAHEFSTRCAADGAAAWFRGINDADKSLRSSLHRHVDAFTEGMKSPPTQAVRRGLLRAEYKMLYRRFKSAAWPLLGSRARNEWGIIFAMQHHGLPTRLLDWSEAFAPAVFFALDGRKPGTDAAIWCLDPEALNDKALGQEGMVHLDESNEQALVDSCAWHPRWPAPDTDLPSIAALPIVTTARMSAQRSAFTVAGDSPLSLDAEYPAVVTRGRLTRLVIADGACTDAERYLATAGFDAFTIYPDLEGLARKHGALTEERIRNARKFYPDAF